MGVAAVLRKPWKPHELAIAPQFAAASGTPQGPGDLFYPLHAESHMYATVPWWKHGIDITRTGS